MIPIEDIDWENAEQARLDAHKNAIAQIEAMAHQGNDSMSIKRVMSDLNAMEFPKTKCEEFHLEYQEAQTEALCILRERHKNAQEFGNSVNRDVFALLVKSGIDKESAKIIVDLASKNQLGALKIIY
jgi:hypothetical protein